MLSTYKNPLCSIPTRGLLVAFLALGASQSNAALEPDTVEKSAIKTEVFTEQATPARLQVGQATEQMLELQRKAAAPRPRPIDGDQASRSYQRYLKSFETTIPEHYDTGLGVKKQ